MQKITVHTGRPYEILIDDGLLEQAGDLVRRVSGAKRICLISDSNVYPLYGNRVVQALESADFQVCTLVFDAGEASKKPETVLNMVNYMAREGLTRGDLVVALGGGVCGGKLFARHSLCAGANHPALPGGFLCGRQNRRGSAYGQEFVRCLSPADFGAD